MLARDNSSNRQVRVFANNARNCISIWPIHTEKQFRSYVADEVTLGGSRGAEARGFGNRQARTLCLS